MAVSVGRFEVQSDILSLCSVCVSVCFVSEDFVLFLCDSSSSKVSMSAKTSLGFAEKCTADKANKRVCVQVVVVVCAGDAAETTLQGADQRLEVVHKRLCRTAGIHLSIVVS